MKTQKLLSIIALVLLLTSCASASTQAPLPTITSLPQTETIAPTFTSTPGPTKTPTPTSTPDIATLSIAQIFELYRQGGIEYVKLSDEQRRELAILIRDYLIQDTPDTVTTSSTWKDGTFSVGLTNTLQWKRVDLTPAEEFQGAADKLAPVVAACYENQARDVVLIGPNGEEYVVPRFNVDGPLAGKKVAEIAALSLTEKQQIAEQMMFAAADARGFSEQKKQSMRTYLDTYPHYFSVMFLDPFYGRNNLYPLWRDSQGRAHDDTATNVVDVVMVNEKGDIAGCARVQQAAAIEQHLFDFTVGQTPSWEQRPFLVSQDIFGRSGDSVALFGSRDSDGKGSSEFLLAGGNDFGGNDTLKTLSAPLSLEEAKALFRRTSAIFDTVDFVIGDLQDRD